MNFADSSGIDDKHPIRRSALNWRNSKFKLGSNRQIVSKCLVVVQFSGPRPCAAYVRVRGRSVDVLI